MPKRAPEVSELAQALKAPAFENRDADRTPARLDPVTPTTLVLSVAEIKAYDHNPRLAENREYPRLKDSIRARRGLTTPLTVTKRPGDDHYMIGAGGNSRLRALKELAEETGDDAFARVSCRFEPWDSEAQVLANHLIENDIRGYILFGDKARAIVQWRDLYEDAHPDEAPLSQRALTDCLAQAGYRIPQSLLNRLIQAAEVLMPHLPRVFASGLGRPAVEQLIRLRSIALKYWDDQAADMDQAPSPTFDNVFAATCVSSDCHYQDWDYDLFQSVFAVELARALRLDPKAVALDLDSLYHGYPVDTSALAEPRSKDPLGLKSEWAGERLREIEARKAERVRVRLDGSAGAGESSAAGSLEVPESAETTPDDSSDTAEPAPDPNRLRQSNFAIARRIAEVQDLEDWVKPLETGFGFFMEAPEPPASHEAADESAADAAEGVVLKGARSIGWWFLCLVSDALAPAHLPALARAYPASWLVELFLTLPEKSPETRPLAALDLLVGEPPRDLVWQVLTDPDFTDDEMALFSDLMRGCRALRAAAADGRLTLWEEGS